MTKPITDTELEELRKPAKSPPWWEPSDNPLVDRLIARIDALKAERDELRVELERMVRGNQLLMEERMNLRGEIQELLRGER